MCFTISKHQALFKTYVPNGLWSRRFKPPQTCTPSHTSSIQLSWFFKASWISPRRLEITMNIMQQPSKHRLKSSQICPFLLGFLKRNPQPSHLFEPRSDPTWPKAPMSKRIVEISAVIVACGCWESYEPRWGRPQRIWCDESMSLQEVYLKLIISITKKLKDLQIHTGFTVSISSNTLDTHEYHCALLHTLAAGDDGVGSIHTSTHLIQVHIHSIHCRGEVLPPTMEHIINGYKT